MDEQKGPEQYPEEQPKPTQPAETPTGPPVLSPEEKAKRFGCRGLSHAEALAVMAGVKVSVAEAVVQKYGVPGLGSVGLNELAAVPGIGKQRALRVLAALEYGRRVTAPPSDEPRIGSPAEAFAIVRDLKTARKEHLIALYLDAQNRLITRETVSIGSLNTTRTHPREVLQPAILAGALAFVLAHNHPSGSLDASRDDIEFTRTMQRAGELMGIALFDHLIVSRKGYTSLRERGLMP